MHVKFKIMCLLNFQEFSTAYVDANPGKVSDNPDTILVLAFAIIMLNTDLHSPNVKRKMSKEEFTRNLRGMQDCRNSIHVDTLNNMPVEKPRRCAGPRQNFS